MTQLILFFIFFVNPIKVKTINKLHCLLVLFVMLFCRSLCWIKRLFIIHMTQTLHDQNKNEKINVVLQFKQQRQTSLSVSLYFTIKEMYRKGVRGVSVVNDLSY